MTPAEAATHLRPRVEGDREQRDPRRRPRGARGGRLRPPHHGRRRPARQGVARRRSTGGGTPRPRSSSTPSPPRRRRRRSPDSGDLRTDLMTAFCGMGGLTDHDTRTTFGAVMTALSTDPEFAAEFRARVLLPKSQLSRAIFQRAVDRGEVRDDLDLDLVAPALAGIVLHRLFVMGEKPGPQPHRARHRPDHPAGRGAAGLRASRSHSNSPRKEAHVRTDRRHRGSTSPRSPRATVRAAPGMGPGADLHRPAHGGARRHDREHRPALHRQRSPHVRHEPHLDRHRLRPRLRRPAAARRPARRPLRPPQGLHGRPRRSSRSPRCSAASPRARPCC